MKTWPGCLLGCAVGIGAVCAEETPRQVPLVAAGGARVAAWQDTPRPNKPYIAQLFAPGARPVALLDDSPSDHFHHHGLMFALSADGMDFWTENTDGTFGRQVPVATEVFPDSAGFRRRLEWRSPTGEVLLEEARTVMVRSTGAGRGGVHWLDWTSILTPAGGREAVRLSGHHYFGLGMRFLPAWSGKGMFEWQATTGQKVVRGDEKLTPGHWCAVRCEIEGTMVTVLIVNDAANARPGRWFTMARPFCYLSATLGLDAEPAELRAGDTWTLRYGIAVLASDADRDRLSKLARDWRSRTARLKPNPSPTKKP